MTNETRRRIRAYKKALPELRERVIAVALLLALSVSMVASASFAWLTISRNPEVSGANTTVAANGNIEIALATGTTLSAIVPKESQVGDSSAAQDVTKANITWGNLINLSDPSYGLDNLTLRPAQLNRSSLLFNPLYGATYQSDGRVEKLNSDFGFASWKKDEKGNELFLISDDIGVRAISSVTVEAVGWPKEVYDMSSKATNANLLAGSAYTTITSNSAYMNTLAVVMGTFMTAKMNAGQGDESLTNPAVNQKDIQNLRDLFRDFLAVYDLQFQAMAELATFQLFLIARGTGYETVTAADIKAGTTKATQVSGLNTALSDYNKLMDGYAKLVTLAEQGTVKWQDSGLNEIVNNLMNVSACTLDGTPIGNIGASNATNYLGKTCNAEITNGVLYNFEHLNGATCDVKGLTVSAKIKRMGMTIPGSITANIATSQKKSTDPALFYSDMTYANTLNTGGTGIEIAQDTYGLALDIWVRTNASSSYLILEGNILTKTDYVDAVGTDINGNTVDIYTLSRSETAEDGTETTYTLDLYKLATTAADGTETTTWYNADTHATVELEDGENPTRKKNEVVTVIGYEGENRIWEDANAWENNSQLSLDSTTQGAGSCYVYYADTPEDQARSLELLNSMRVAFVDDKGVLLATAAMDPERYFAENGRVTVPLLLESDSTEIGTDSNTGDPIYAITALEQNVPKRITAIVYLDGTKLGNENVLAASDIQGKLNIQFGSSVKLSHADDETLLAATRSVTATVSQNYFEYDTSKADGTPMTTTVTVNVDGDVPKKVTGFFIRAISSTQGSREKVMTFEPQADGSWKADYTFTAPGEYMLRSVELDGQNYDLATPPSVTVEGFTINSLSYSNADTGTITGNHASIMTATSSFSVGLELAFASSDPNAMPTTVQGRFLRTDGTAVNVNFTYNATTGNWTGRANFISSGDYTLQYLLLDGEYTELDEGMWKTATVKLGMKSAVYTTSPSEFLFAPGEWDPNDEEDQKKLNLSMSVAIMDNAGNVLQGLQDAHLYYSLKGSSLQERGLNAPLTWNGSTGYYECEFQSKVGEFRFSHITVGENIITYAQTSPTFRIFSPVPPTFNRGVSLAQQYVAPKAAPGTLKVILNDCQVGTIVADVSKNGSNETVALTGSYVDIEGEDGWVFQIPQDNEGCSDGQWTIKRLRLWEVYDKDGNEYTETNPLVFDMTGKTGVTAKVISTVNISFAEDKSWDFSGKAFLTPYTVGDDNGSDGVDCLYVDFKDFAGQSLVDSNGNLLISNVQLVLEYVNQSSGEYGGYTSDQLTNASDGATVTINLSPVTDGDHKGIRFTQTKDAELLYAGKYTTTLKYSINNSAQSVTASDPSKKPIANMPMFTVSTNSPTVTITAISPTDTFDVDKTGVGSGHASATVPAFTGTEATVYFKCSRSGSGSTCDPYRHNYTRPSVTITLNNKGNATGAELAFGTNVHIYNGTTQTTGYSWSVDGACARNIGYYRSRTAANDDKTPAGDLTATSLVLTYGDKTYTVNVSITIHNPY